MYKSLEGFIAEWWRPLVDSGIARPESSCLGLAEQPFVNVISYKQQPEISLPWLTPHNARVKTFLNLSFF